MYSEIEEGLTAFEQERLNYVFLLAQYVRENNPNLFNELVDVEGSEVNDEENTVSLLADFWLNTLEQPQLAELLEEYVVAEKQTLATLHNAAILDNTAPSPMEFSGGVGCPNCNNYFLGVYSDFTGEWSDAELSACMSECGGTPDGGLDPDEEEAANVFCQYFSSNPVCDGQVTPEDLQFVKTILCIAFPDLAFCGGGGGSEPTGGCNDGEVLCIKNGVSQCSNPDDCDGQEEPTDWTKIALIGGGVLVLTIGLVFAFRRRK